MNTDPKLLTLMQWLSPAYPVGTFAWSHGLEAAIATGWVRDGEGLKAWLTDILQSGSGWTDAVWIAQGFRAGTPAELTEVHTAARAFAPANERLVEAERQGRAFATVTRAVWAIDLPDGLLPVVLGRAARLMEMNVEAVTALYLQSFTSNLISAAQRLMPLGQTDGQRLLSRLAPTCTEVAAASNGVTMTELYSNTFLSDIAAMRHETLQPRLFQS
ncbi:urease accessory protein UreF [Sulfitobacter sp. JB4-11]|uniref:urease accessory protein UreF n=1 Tax=Sulfitobacter rhodophyticola TaxID=3238304 RepID=UPI003516AB5D